MPWVKRSEPSRADCTHYTVTDVLLNISPISISFLASSAFRCSAVVLRPDSNALTKRLFYINSDRFPYVILCQRERERKRDRNVFILVRQMGQFHREDETIPILANSDSSRMRMTRWVMRAAEKNLQFISFSRWRCAENALNCIYVTEIGTWIRGNNEPPINTLGACWWRVERILFFFAIRMWNKHIYDHYDFNNVP